MFKLLILTLLSIIIFAGFISATIINIPDDYGTIQAGINASTNGDTVLVQPGTYVENINFNGHNIVLGSLFLITGDTSYINQTTIQSNQRGTAVTFLNVDSTAVVVGFTITGVPIRDFVRGDGIFCFNSNPVISHNIISVYKFNEIECIKCFNISNPVLIDNIFIPYDPFDYSGMFKSDKNRSINMPNPASIYIASLGYKSETRKTDQGGQRSVVIFPDGSECNQWDFYAGRCGQEWTCCARSGYELEVRDDGKDGFNPQYTVCIFPDGSKCKEFHFALGMCGTKWRSDCCPQK